MRNIINEIVEMEWEDFQGVHNKGGRAPCQDERREFEINRQSQFLAWSEAALGSYLNDLKAARASGRNLLMEKYARMMAWTHPAEYKRIEQMLPGVPRASFALIDKIVPIQLAWQKDFAAACPRLAARARPLENGSAASASDTSFETYLRGELLTYSVPTLTLYANHVEHLKQQGLNLNMQAMEHLARLSGFATLAEAEANA